MGDIQRPHNIMMKPYTDYGVIQIKTPDFCHDISVIQHRVIT